MEEVMQTYNTYWSKNNEYTITVILRDFANECKMKFPSGIIPTAAFESGGEYEKQTIVNKQHMMKYVC